MPHHKKDTYEKHAEDIQYWQDHMKHWRAWGSWFSWGSPVGLGLFFLSLAGTVWVLAQAFGW